MAWIRERVSEGFEEMMAHQEKIFLICLGFSRNAADAEDLAQEVYLKAFRKIGSLKDPALLKTWLLRIAKNTCLDFRKKQRLSRFFLSGIEKVAQDNQTPESQLALQEQLRLLKKSIQRLPRIQREVFVLREYGGLSYQEIAETLKIKEGTVMSRLNRARQVLRIQLEGVQHEKE